MIKYFSSYIYKILFGVFAIWYCMHASSCANTKGAPSGGPKDTIPPTVVSVVPPVGATDFPLEKGEIIITFNEYVQVKDANKNILLSPPQKKPVKNRIKGKSVIFTFQEPLDSNRTYSLSIGQSILDNNEGNPMNGYSYAFSTGNTIDSMMLSGTVVDAVTLFPIKNATVALYLNAKDSSALKELPDAVARTDEWGYFTVKNIKPLPYSVFAFSDENTNNMYDQGVEKIAFSDCVFTPVEVMRENSPQLAAFDPKDTVSLKARPTELELYLFSEKSTNQYIRDYKRLTKRGAYIKFNASDVQIDSFAIAGIDTAYIIKHFNITKDSLNFWINEPETLQDTLLLSIKYHKTDSTGNLSPAVENLKLIAPVERKKDNKSSSRVEEKRKDLLEFKIDSDNKKVEQDGIVLSFKEPLSQMLLDSISFKMTNPKQIVSDVEYTFKQDSVELNNYVIRPVSQFEKGNDYTLYFPQATFRDINGFTNDSTLIKLTLPNSDNMSSISVELLNVETRYIVELVDEKRSTVYRKYIINEPCTLNFPYLARGKYSIRITEDKNNNGLFDTGDMLLKKQPEKVLLYALPDGGNIINLNDRTDLEQTIDIAQMFGK